MFKKMTVGKKIIMGFSAVLVLLVVVGGSAYYGLNSSSDGFTQYREMARDANLAGRLQANMLMVRMNVKDYLITGSDKDLKQYDQYWEKMEEFQAEAQKEIQKPERAAKIDAVETAMGTYGPAFSKVVDYMNRRNEYVNGVLNVKGPLMENTLTDIMVSARDDNDMTASYYTGLPMKHLLLARLYMAKFLDTNDQKSVDRVHEEFDKMQDNLNVLDTELQNPERRRMLSTVTDAKEAYVTTFNDLVATIFSRNDVITNTLDVLGPEIAADVEDVKLDIKGVQDTLGPQLVASNARSITLISIVGVIALLLGAFLAFGITRGINVALKRTIEGLKDGSELVGKTNEAFTEVAGSTGKVGELVGEIAAASGEQAEGIEQVNRAVGEMDKVVQQNAANAEESASASEEMNAQAMQMQQYVDGLVTMVGGSVNGNGGGGSPVRSLAHNAPPVHAAQKSLAAAPRGMEINPEELIPMGKEDFKDF